VYSVVQIGLTYDIVLFDVKHSWGDVWALTSCCIFLDERERLIVPVATRQLRDVNISCTRGYPTPIRCPMDTGMGINFYPRVWSWVEMSYTHEYHCGRTFALPIPYPTRCHPYPTQDHRKSFNTFVSFRWDYTALDRFCSTWLVRPIDSNVMSFLCVRTLLAIKLFSFQEMKIVVN
jgi:hypothetical protein